MPASVAAENEPRTRPRTQPSAGMGKNGGTVLAAIDGETTLAQISERTELTDRQARYAVKQLIEAGLVRMEGGPGRRGTTYSRIAHPPPLSGE